MPDSGSMRSMFTKRSARTARGTTLVSTHPSALAALFVLNYSSTTLIGFGDVYTHLRPRDVHAKTGTYVVSILDFTPQIPR